MSGAVLCLWKCGRNYRWYGRRCSECDFGQFRLWRIAAGDIGIHSDRQYHRLDSSATTVIANSGHGVWLMGSSNNTVGGSAVGAGNIISEIQAVVCAYSTSKQQQILGNIIGTNALSAAGLGNTGSGILLSHASANNTIGGTTSGARNIISGNTLDGITITSSGTTGTIIQGNYIGTDVSGTSALGNGRYGIQITGGADGNTIGGTATGAGNVISGNASSASTSAHQTRWYAAT